MTALVAVVALGSVPGALAGGSFERIVGVGANGAWQAIKLGRAGPRSDVVLGGKPAPVPSGGYVRLYPFIGWLPAIPGRFYPVDGIVCFYWREPVSGCARLAGPGRKLLASFARLPLRHEAPTAPVAVRYRSALLRYADGNIFAALELALERPPVARTSSPRNAVALSVVWRGPRARWRPGRLELTPIGVYTPGHLFPLQRGPWCYLAGNLPRAGASLFEATTRVCR